MSSSFVINRGGVEYVINGTDLANAHTNLDTALNSPVPPPTLGDQKIEGLRNMEQRIEQFRIEALGGEDVSSNDSLVRLAFLGGPTTTNYLTARRAISSETDEAINKIHTDAHNSALTTLGRADGLRAKYTPLINASTDQTGINNQLTALGTEITTLLNA